MSKKIVIGIVLIFFLSFAFFRVNSNTTFLMNTSDIEFDKTLYQTNIQDGKLLFYETKSLNNEKLLGLVLIEDKLIDRIILSNAHSISSKVTLDILGTSCGIGCRPMDIVTLIPKDSLNLWFVITSEVNDIEWIKGFSKEGDIIYSYQKSKPQ